MSDSPPATIEPVWFVEATYAPDAAETRGRSVPNTSPVCGAPRCRDVRRGRGVRGRLGIDHPRARRVGGRGASRSCATTSTSATGCGSSCGLGRSGGSAGRTEGADRPASPGRGSIPQRIDVGAGEPKRRSRRVNPSARSRPGSADARTASCWRRRRRGPRPARASRSGRGPWRAAGRGRSPRPGPRRPGPSRAGVGGARPAVRGVHDDESSAGQAGRDWRWRMRNTSRDARWSASFPEIAARSASDDTIESAANSACQRRLPRAGRADEDDEAGVVDDEGRHGVVGDGVVRARRRQDPARRTS